MNFAWIIKKHSTLFGLLVCYRNITHTVLFGVLHSITNNFYHPNRCVVGTKKRVEFSQLESTDDKQEQHIIIYTQQQY